MHIVDFTFRSLISSVLAASKVVMGSVYSGEQDGVENWNYSMQNWLLPLVDNRFDFNDFENSWLHSAPIQLGTRNPLKIHGNAPLET